MKPAMMSQEELTELYSEVNRCPKSKLGEYYDTVVGQLNLYPHDYRLQLLFASVCQRSRHTGVAHAVIQHLIRAHGDRGAVRFQYGAILDQLGDHKGALHQYALARKDPAANVSMLHSNISTAQLKLGNFAAALSAADEATRLEPGMPEAGVNKAFALINMGCLQEGWQAYELALKTDTRTAIDYGLPIWDGEKDARVIVHGEQGMGDEIMYASMLDELKAQVAAVAFDCDPRLSVLFKRSFPEITVVGSRAAKREQKAWLAKFNGTHQIAIGSLCKFFRNSVGSFPRTPYLKAHPDYTRAYRALLCDDRETPIIGLAWSGGTADTRDADREIPLEVFRQIIEAQDEFTIFVSLQYREDAQAQIDESGLPIVHHHGITGRGASYEHTAAMIAACDRVIATDTTVIHAAGALGVQTDCLLSTPCMWVHAPWQKERSAWYGSVKLHRKSEGEDWASYIEHLTRNKIL